MTNAAPYTVVIYRNGKCVIRIGCSTNEEAVREAAIMRRAFLPKRGEEICIEKNSLPA